jgi:DNA polymerase I
LDGDGWGLRLKDTDSGLLTVRNFPIQGTAASILRRVIIEAAKANIEIVGPLHDAVLIQAPAAEAKQYAEKMCRIMREVSSQFLNSHEIRVASHIYRDRFEDKDGKADWERVSKILEKYNA